MKTRRTLLKQASAAVAVSALSYQRVLGANDRINLALTGCGIRGRIVASLMAKVPDVAYVAVCDVSDNTISQAQSSEFVAADAKGYKDFRKIFDDKSIHAPKPSHGRGSNREC